MNETAGGLDWKRRALFAAAALAGLGMPASAVAQGPVPDAPGASEQLEEAVAAFEVTDPQASEPTLELRDLALALPRLEGAERRKARALLARPSAGNGAYGGSWTTSEADNSPHCDARFCVHWVDATADRPDRTDTGGEPGVPDYVELVLLRARESFIAQNAELGWPPPKSDGTRGGDDGKTDIYLADICDPRDSCIFGYASTDPQPSRIKRFAYLVLDNDYDPREFKGYDDPDIPLSVTTAHEYNHVLQFGIDSMQDRWMFESTATWAEEQVFPDGDDWLFFLRGWARQPQQPITSDYAGGGLRIYGTAVWNHWLERGGGHGAEVVLDAWLASRKTRPKSFAVAAYDRAIKGHGGAGFAREFARFAAATAEWQVPSTGDFPDAAELPKVRRRGTLERRGEVKGFRLNHAAYRLLRVRPRWATDVVKLRVVAPPRVRTGVALVGRAGTGSNAAVVKKAKYLPRGGSATVRLTGTESFKRMTAVVANADARIRGADGFDWNYTRDGKTFRARVR